MSPTAPSPARRVIEFLYSDDCPTYDEAWSTLRSVVELFGLDWEIRRRPVSTLEQARELAFPGSPTIRVDGVDVDPAGAEERPSLACRIYRRPDGRPMPVPSREMLMRGMRLYLAPGAAAPDFHLPGVDGRDHDLHDYDDRQLLVLVQFCNHCPFAQAWEGRLNDFAREFAARSVATVAICSNDPEAYPEDSFDEMVTRAREHHFHFDYLHDADQTLAKALGATRTPEVFVFDRDRRLAYHGAIDDSRDDPGAVREPYLRDAVQALVSPSGRAPDPADTPAQGCFVKWRW